MDVAELCPELADRVGSARKCILFLCTVSDGLEVGLESLSQWKVHSSTWSQTLLVMCAWSRLHARVSLMPFLLSFQL